MPPSWPDGSIQALLVLSSTGTLSRVLRPQVGNATEYAVVDGPLGSQQKPFMLHYSFPPFCTNEVGVGHDTFIHSTHAACWRPSACLLPSLLITKPAGDEEEQG